MAEDLASLIQKFKIPIALSLVGIVLIIGGLVLSGSKPAKKDFPKESLVQADKMLSVDVSGAVQKPGVYQLKEGSRIEDVISLAGGFNASANKEYISKYLNLAQKISDGSKVYVPAEGETAISGNGGSVAGVQSKVNINQASESELEALPGVGSATAAKIISGRPYQSTDELLSKKVVGKSVFDKIKDSVSVY